MAAGVNAFVGVGRFAADPQVTKTASSTLAKFPIAIQRLRHDKDGNTITDFFNCQAWGNVAQSVNLYGRKGLLVAVEGAFENNVYVDPNTQQKKTFTYINCHYVKILGKNEKPDGTEDKAHRDPSGYLDPSDLPF